MERLLVSGIFESGLHEDWEQYIRELLAQPEHKPFKPDWVSYRQGVEDTTREPLSDEQIEYYLERLGSSFKWDDGFRAGVEWAERCHGITGVDDE